MKILNALTQYIETLATEPMANFVVAYSGGVDSHVLLHALSILRDDGELIGKLHAIHIHHGLSTNGDKWQNHCQQVCEELKVQFHTANLELENQSRTSLEALAREARYNKLIELAPNHAHILLGQHQDDQLETFLLQLKRGAGPKGLSAMNQTWQQQDASSKCVSYHRPLLVVSQQAILAYAQQHQLNWCEDESNQNTDFDRNFLRHEVLPILQKRWPELAKSVSRSATLCSQQQTMLDDVCAEKLSKLIQAGNSLNIDALLELSTHWTHQVVRYWLSQQGIQNPSFAVLERLVPEVLNAADDANPILQWQTWQFRRFNQALYVVQMQEKIQPVSIHWHGQEKIELPNNSGQLTFNGNNDDEISGVKVNSEDGDLTIILGRYSTRFTPQGSPHSKPLKQWFKLWQVPPWKRDSVIQLVQNNKIVALYVDGKWLVSSQSSESKTQSSMVTVSYIE